MPERIGRYRITGKLGEGGMGVVYRAYDDRLDRSIAIKMIRRDIADSLTRERLVREARAAASINHPSVCQLYEIAEEGGELFIAMELVEGETLSDRIRRGPLAPLDAAGVALSLVGALEALHARGIVHRDLKPSNVFLVAHGVKLVDFGLARPIDTPLTEQASTALTLPGTVVGTPQYMAPEQALGQAVGARTDLYAVGVILFEMLTGAPPFSDNRAIEVLHRVMHEQPPALTGSAAIVAIDRIIRKALAKAPAERYANAAEMADALRAVISAGDAGTGELARPVTRLIVLPFRVLRPDPDTDFLAFSLPDAITSSLSGLQSLVIRSSAAAAKFAGATPDVSAMARDADVDVVLTGTLLRAGGEIRVNTQLAEAPGGSLLWSHTAQIALGDIFQLQDELTRRIVESLKLPLTTREQRMLRHDVPASAQAYEFYLRGNQLADNQKTWPIARDLYLQCLDVDPRYAPAWARLARVYRLMGKYEEEGSEENLSRAEDALKLALDINAELPLAHSMYAQLDVDVGRADAALLRLVDRAKTRGADPEIFAGLVYACRFCGLLSASIAAHEQARRLDATIRTSVVQTYWMRGEYERVAAIGMTAAPYVGALALAALGRAEEAIRALTRIEQAGARIPRAFIVAARTLLEGKHQESAEAARRLGGATKDPEGLYYAARHLAHLGDTDTALNFLERAIDGGFFAYPVLVRDGWLKPLEQESRFVELLRRADARHRAAAASFVARGGDTALGLTGEP